MPFFGKAYVAYIPKGKVIGLSKIPRIVEIFSRRLQLQERMTQQIANTLNDVLNDIKVSNALYSAIITDTGSFRYSNTNSKTHIIASSLINNGVIIGIPISNPTPNTNPAGRHP